MKAQYLIFVSSKPVVNLVQEIQITRGTGAENLKFGYNTGWFFSSPPIHDHFYGFVVNLWLSYNKKSAEFQLKKKTNQSKTWRVHLNNVTSI